MGTSPTITATTTIDTIHAITVIVVFVVAVVGTSGGRHDCITLLHTVLVMVVVLLLLLLLLLAESSLLLLPLSALLLMLLLLLAKLCALQAPVVEQARDAPPLLVPSPPQNQRGARRPGALRGHALVTGHE